MVVGAPRLGGALGTAPFVVAGGGLTVAGVVVVEPDASVVDVRTGTTVGTIGVVAVVAVVVRAVDWSATLGGWSRCVRALESRRVALDPEASFEPDHSDQHAKSGATDTAMVVIRAMAVLGGSGPSALFSLQSLEGGRWENS